MKLVATRKTQQGVALIMSLVILLILTILGVSSVQNTSLQERMARNARDSNLAFQAAESAILEAEIYLAGVTALTPFQTANTEGRYPGNDTMPPPPVDHSSFDWDDPSNNAMQFNVVDTNIDGVAVQPRYIIEFMQTVVSDEDRLNLDNIGQDTGSGRTQVFRVTAYGTGGTDVANVLIQTTYGRRF